MYLPILGILIPNLDHRLIRRFIHLQRALPSRLRHLTNRSCPQHTRRPMASRRHRLWRPFRGSRTSRSLRLLLQNLRGRSTLP